MSLRYFFYRISSFIKRTIFGSAGAYADGDTYEVDPDLSPDTHQDSTEYIRVMQLRLPTLTARELEVVWCIREGYSNDEIASALKISLATTKTHVHNILVKMNLRSRWELKEMLIHMEFGRPPRLQY